MSSLISILIPCYNPSHGWEQVLIQQYNNIVTLSPKTYEYEIILINDGAILPTEIIHTLFHTIPRFNYIVLNQNFGKGYAIRKGAFAAKGKYIFLTDIDFPYSNENFFSMLSVLESGSDLSWVVREDSYYNTIPLLRKILSKFLQIIIALFFKMPFKDTQGGLKGMNKKTLKILQQTITNRYLYDLEFISISYRNKLKLQPIIGQLRTGIKASSIPLKVLFDEFFTLIKLIFK